MKLYACSTFTQGSHHKKNGTKCQDYAKSLIDNTIGVAAAADGGGSKKYAKQSAVIAVNALLSYIKKTPFQEFKKDDLAEWIVYKMKSSGLPEEELGTTLMFVIIQNEKCLIGHVGDGVIIQGTDDDFDVVSWPENGMYVNETFFLPSCAKTSHFRVKEVNTTGDTGCFILSSDGISELLYDGETGKGMKVCAKLKEWSIDPAVCKKLIRKSFRDVFSKYTSDDMSLAIISWER